MNRQRREGPGRGKPKDDLKITPAKTQALIDVSTPSPNAPQFGGKALPTMTTMVNVNQNPPLRKPAATNFMDSNKFVTMNSTTTHAVGGKGNCKNANNRRSCRRRANVDAMMRSNTVRQSLSLSSASVSSSSGVHKKSRYAAPAPKEGDFTYGPPPGSDVVTVPIPGDCNFEQKYNVAMSMDEKAYTPMEKLEALRDAMGNLTDKDGYIERETFSQAFEVDGNEFDGYATGNGTIDGNAILIDAVMNLGVGAEQKLRFIFDTLDPDNTGYVIEDQIVQLLESNFSNAKIDVVGVDFKTVAKLMFRKARVQNGAMTFDQFKEVFLPYVTDSYHLDVAKPVYSAPNRPKSKFGRW
ncbi:NADPH oxidase 4 [Phytophthora boehmeriae]|uniref:NADPH oxidase 4 n=1 Tax=Phytophthora boehmeriae TaxID=109152 RepID=A0A8T1X2T2_9STRA|nr:NADPH oxidase 4 [Phytophthora boehmeriae]